MSDKRMPKYVLRAKESPDSDRWVSVGAVWPTKDGDVFSVRLNVLPVNFDGSCVMMKPKEQEQ